MSNPPKLKQGNILDQIIAHKRQEIATIKTQLQQAQRATNIQASSNSFIDNLQKDKLGYILEFKMASPSKGVMRSNHDWQQIIDIYSLYGNCISVLTDNKFFNGSYDLLGKIRKITTLPILHKDFIIDPTQILYGRLQGADAVLLMLSVLDNSTYQKLSALAADLNMTVLTEVNNQQEAARAKQLQAKLIGINNRNLKDLSIDMSKTAQLAQLFDHKQLLVSESGIKDRQDIQKLANYSQKFLVGSSLMQQLDIKSATKNLIFGQHKVCGLTKLSDAKAADQAGAFFGGLIFYPQSPRCIDINIAQSIKQETNLQLVGVFVDSPLAELITTTKKLQLSAIQLHGSESDDYIKQLRDSIDTKTEIWKAYSIQDKWPKISQLVDRWLFDGRIVQQQATKSQSFDWDILKKQSLNKPFILAGGIGLHNLTQALSYSNTLDLNSGLEDSPGHKNHQKIKEAFKLIRNHYDRT